MLLLLLPAFLFFFFKVSRGADLPQQVHLSYHGDPTQMHVTWITMHEGSFELCSGTRLPLSWVIGIRDLWKGPEC